MYRFIFALFAILALATFASHAATGQTIPPKPVHLPIIRFDETPTPPLPTATATATPTATETPALPTATATSTVYEFNIALLQKCDPNAGVTYMEGTTYKGGQPASGYLVAVGYAPDGPILMQVPSGPHDGHLDWNAGFYSHILDASGPREGDWFFWIVDQMGQRISEIANVHTDGQVAHGSCQQGVIDFDSR